MSAVSILRPGMFTTVQDLGRWGYQSRGVPVSGAMDWYSHRLANGLLGNHPATATLEITLVGPHLRFDATAVFAVTGAECRMTLDDATIEMNRAIEAKAGSVLKIGERLGGARAYVAVGGGIDVPEVLGSRSTHVLTGMGGHQGRALRAGDRLSTGSSANVTKNEKRGSDPLRLQNGAKLRVIAADDRMFAQLASQRFRVSPQSNRMGYRLEGASIADATSAGVPNAAAALGWAAGWPGEIISTAVPTGAIQVPPMGQPILLMNDHATTGGYAIAGTVITADLPVAGQLAPGDWVEFEACSIETARAELRRREAALDAA